VLTRKDSCEQSTVITKLRNLTFVARTKSTDNNSGFYGVGILHTDDHQNIGTLWRSAFVLGASYIFTVDKKYKRQGSDVHNAWTSIPLYHFKTMLDLKNNLPYSTKLVAVEMSEDSKAIETFEHPSRAVYLLGNERIGLSPRVMSECHDIVKLPGSQSLNVAVAGSLVMYDRLAKAKPTPVE